MRTWIFLAAAALALSACKGNAEELKVVANRKVASVGAPSTDRDHVARALLVGGLALDALEQNGASSSSEAEVLGKSLTSLEEQTGGKRGVDPAAVKASLAESERFDEKGQFTGESMALHGLVGSIDSKAANAWTHLGS